MATRDDIVVDMQNTQMAFHCKACGLNFHFMPAKEVFTRTSDKTLQAESDRIANAHVASCEMEKHGPVERWAHLLNLPVEAVRERLAGVKGITAKLHDGTVLTNGFFGESNVRRACDDLLNPKPADGGKSILGD